MKSNRLLPLTILALFLAAWAAVLTWAAPLGGGKLVVTFVGLQEHGLAIVVQTPAGRTFLYDAGSKGKTYDAGRDSIGPLLKARGVREVAGMVLSHPHGDHVGGAPWLLENFPVKCLVDSGFEGRGQSDAYRAIRRQAQERGAKYVVVHAGDRLAWDKALEVEVLSPPKEFLLLDADPAKVSEHSVLNNNSIVLRIQHGKNVFLFPGDVYGAEYSYLLKTWKEDKLRANVLCAPHHGFNETPAYAATIKPEIVFCACIAYYEKSEVPSPGDLAEKIFGPVGAKVYTMAQHGSVQITSDGRALKVKTDRSPSSSDRPSTPKKRPAPMPGGVPAP